MGKTVVLVDDSQFLLNQLASFFRDTLKFDVIAMGNDGVDAVNLYKTHKPDLLTLDITMPFKDGKTALIEIMKDFPDAKIMMISAVKGSTMLECMSAGAKGYIEKPLNLSNPDYIKDFENTVSEIFAG